MTRISIRLVATLICLIVPLFFGRTALAGDGEGLADMRAAAGASSSTASSTTIGTFQLGAYGYVRGGYALVQKDPRYDFIGRNNGFYLDSARVGLEARSRDGGLTVRISVEGASDMADAPNTPMGTLEVRLRDAFVRWDPHSVVGIQLGQYKAPFAFEELRGIQDLMFASRAVGQIGVAPGKGFQEPGIAIDRQLGAMVSPAKPIMFGDFGFSYYAMLMNGNGPNQLYDDNGNPGYVGRLELLYSKYVQLGGAGYRNFRTVGTPPNLYNENDVGIAADALVRVEGLEVFGQYAQVTTAFPTVGAKDRTRVAYHAQIGYRFDNPYVPFAPAYRYAHYHPWASGGGAVGNADYDGYKIDYHTLGLRVWHPTLPLQAYVNYTLKMEPSNSPRKLDNDELQILVQVVF